MKDFKDISVEVNGNIAYVTIQRPPNNFFDYLLIEQIADAYEDLDQVSDCRVIILSSEGKNRIPPGPGAFEVNFSLRPSSG